MNETQQQALNHLKEHIKTHPEDATVTLYLESIMPLDTIQTVDTYDELIRQCKMAPYGEIYDHIDYTISRLFSMIGINNFDLIPEEKTELQNIIKDDININFNDTLYANIFPHQRQNLNTEGSELRDAMSNLVDNMVNKEGNTVYPLIPIENEVLQKFFKSQGIDITGPFPADHPFIPNFISVLDWIYEGEPIVLTFCVKLTVKQYFDFVNHKIALSTDGVWGLFDPTNGGGGLEEELYKPFAFEYDDEIWSIQIESLDRNYGYTVGDVFGFDEGAWDEPEIIKL